MTNVRFLPIANVCSPQLQTHMNMLTHDELAAREIAWMNREDRDNLGSTRFLALRRVPGAMTELSRRLGSAGSFGNSFSGAGWAYRASKLGDPSAAYNLAMHCFNNRDLRDYRRWLRHAAGLGDTDARAELRRFQTRLPHGAAYDIGRGRPWHRSD